MTAFLVGVAGCLLWGLWRVASHRRRRRGAPRVRLDIPIDPGTRWAPRSRRDDLAGRP